MSRLRAPALILCVASCGAPREQPRVTLPSAPSVSVAPPPVASQGSTLVGFVPPKGMVAVSCQSKSGLIADDGVETDQSKARRYRQCEAPAGARVVVRVQAVGGAKLATMGPYEGCDRKVADCVQSVLTSSGGLDLEPTADGRPETYDCYVAFY
jgi:hypothetical protein